MVKVFKHRQQPFNNTDRKDINHKIIFNGTFQGDSVFEIIILQLVSGFF
jgi:hypothetical protein